MFILENSREEEKLKLKTWKVESLRTNGNLGLLFFIKIKHKYQISFDKEDK